MRMDEPVTVEISGNIYHIYPFSAFKASNLSGELFAVIGPALSGLSALTDPDGEIDTTAFTQFFATLSGDKVEGLLRRLLVANRNISVEYDGNAATWLTGDLADKLFCGEIGAMFRLAVEVVKVNFGDFFAMLGGLFGNADTPPTETTTKS